MTQPTPTVTEADVERVLKRDYPADALDELRAQIAAIEVREKPRVILACLKVGAGDVDRVKGELFNAAGWWREVISEAEYPNSPFNKQRFTPEQLQQRYDKDWAQYSAWLNAE